jgi:hypothetical protein
MPKDLQTLAAYMRQHYIDASEWWHSECNPALQDHDIPKDLLEDIEPASSSEDSTHARPG